MSIPSVNAFECSSAHSAALSGLTPGTLYHYAVQSQDSLGNLATSADFTFTTAGPPLISAVAAGSITSSGATIAWTTDKPSTSQVLYGATAAYGASTILNAALVTAHSAALSGLTPGTLYHYAVQSQDSLGNLATSADFTFTAATTSGTLATFQLHANATEVSGTGNGSSVNPSTTPSGFTGAVVKKGRGSVNFVPAGNGVYFQEIGRAS